MGRSAATTVWRFLDAASSGLGQIENSLVQSMDRTMESMKSQLFKLTKVSKLTGQNSDMPEHRYVKPPIPQVKCQDSDTSMHMSEH
ncbi:hypothetical protein Tcan_15780 [Toxocara canis]|uniref:Uncharacterized protein n=1 Tax=Toxocara canis TaxID=6265 RepID=A0A0B2V7V9_TOXCA|nr:hypothetical protein Tcan_15780 [Toxocara canis]